MENKNIIQDPLYEPKYLVCKWSKIKESLTQTEQDILGILLSKIQCDNDYLVVNQDEPYAEQVWGIIKGAWSE